VVAVTVVGVSTGTAVVVGAVAEAVVSKALVRVKGTVLVGPERSVAVAQADTTTSTKARAREPVL